MVIFSVLILIIIGIVIYQNFTKSSGYVFDKVQKSSLSEVVSESGEIVSNGEVVVNSPTNGFIQEVYVQNGQKVKKDQQLFKVVSSATDQEKQTAYTNYLAAKATLDADTANLYTLQSTMFSAWKTYTDLSTSSTYQNADGSPQTSNRILPAFTTLQDNWFAAEAAYKNQQSVIAKDNAALGTALSAYLATQTTVVKAQLDGVVENLSVSVDDSVAAQSLLNPTPIPVLILTNNPTIQAKITVGQSNIAKVAIGQKVKIFPDAYKDKTFDAVVTRVDSIGTNNQGVVTYNVYATIATNDNLLKSGMTLDSDITTKEIENVLTVPNSAVVLYQSGKAIREFKNNNVVFVPVIIGIKGPDKTQIIKGVSEGEQIITALTNEKAARPSFLGL
ncbi:MAG TPA: HlyD family efflux transporter periplasmic adaptor subunit [Patescibacteria group bacterium]